MSRVGREIIKLPTGVSLSVNGLDVTVNGPKGTLSQTIKPEITVNNADGVVTLTRANDAKQTKSYHGLYNRLIQNMVKGVSEGFSKKLIFAGVGYKANMQGTNLVLNVGYSHPVTVTPENGVTLATGQGNEIIVSGISKEAVGAMASKIRDIRKVEPYHLYGIRYADEVVIKKESKSSAKKK